MLSVKPPFGGLSLGCKPGASYDRTEGPLAPMSPPERTDRFRPALLVRARSGAPRANVGFYRKPTFNCSRGNGSKVPSEALSV